MQRLPQLDARIQVRKLEPAELATQFTAPDEQASARLRPLLAAAATILEPLNCEPVVRAFDPPTLPALYLVSRRSIQAEEMRAAQSSAGDLWSGVLSTINSTVDPVREDRPQLVLNLRNPIMRRVIESPSPELTGLAVQALYGQALLHGHHPLRPQESALLNHSFLGLLDWAIRVGEAG
jgi:molecular chaperone HtpG